MHKEPPRVGLIACEIFFREVAYFAARSPEVLDIVFLPKGLHDLGGAKMRERLQVEIDRLNEKDYSKILLAYALCNNGTAGLTTRRTPVVIPRAHDCITLFLGSRQRYGEYFFNHPGTYFHTTGWLERGKGEAQAFGSQPGVESSLEAFIEKYGEENGRYLWKMLDPLKHYHKIAYIHLSLSGLPDLRKQSQAMAQERGWQWEQLEGDSRLLERLICGPQDEEDFLVLHPGATIVPTHNAKVIDKG